MLTLIAQNGGGGSNATFLISLVLLVGIFYFLLIRPQQRRVRAQRELVQSISIGDDVITIGGAYGTVEDIDEESLTIRMQPDGARMRFVKTAIAKRFVPGGDPDQAEADEGS